MNEEMMQLNEREEIEMLVPFYVTGRISTSDALRVETYLKQNPDFAEHIELARDERAATAAVNEALGFPSARATDRIFEQIASEPQPLLSRTLKERRVLLATVRDFFTAPSPVAVRYAAMAAAAVVLLQAAIVGTLMTRSGGPETGGFEVAGGPKEQAANAPSALVAFQDGATLADMTRALKDVGATIVEGPVQGGFYRIRFAPSKSGAEDAPTRIAALKAQQNIVKTVLPSR